VESLFWAIYALFPAQIYIDNRKLCHFIALNSRTMEKPAHELEPAATCRAIAVRMAPFLAILSRMISP
jgi:hypothetical protein